MTPYERWYREKPELKHLKVWGCVGYALKTDPEKRKMESRVRKLRFVGYDPYNKNSYRMWDEEKKRLYIRRDVKFLENSFDVTARKEKQGSQNVDLSDVSNQEEKVVSDTEVAKEENETNDGNEHMVIDTEIGAESNETQERRGQPTSRLRPIIQAPQRYGWETNEEMERLEWIYNMQLVLLQDIAENQISIT